MLGSPVIGAAVFRDWLPVFDLGNDFLRFQRESVVGIAAGAR